MKIKTKTKKAMMIWLLSFLGVGTYLTIVFYLASAFSTSAAFVFGASALFATLLAFGYAHER